VAREVNVLALIKGEERYVFVYDEISRPLLLETFRTMAGDQEYELSWYDAAVLTEKAWEQALDNQLQSGHRLTPELP